MTTPFYLSWLFFSLASPLPLVRAGIHLMRGIQETELRIHLEGITTIGKPCGASTVLGDNFTCNIAVDGKTPMSPTPLAGPKTRWESDKTDDYHYWFIDLEDEFGVDAVDVMTLHDQYFQGIEARVGNTRPAPAPQTLINVNDVCGERVTLSHATQRWYSFPCIPRRNGRYVSIQRTGSFGPLALVEVIVAKHQHQEASMFTPYTTSQWQKDALSAISTLSSGSLNAFTCDGLQVCLLGQVPPMTTVSNEQLAGGKANFTFAPIISKDALPVSDVAPLLHPQLIFYAPLDHGPNSIGYVSNAMEAVVSPVGEQSEIGRPFFSLQNSVRLSFRLRYDTPTPYNMTELSFFVWVHDQLALLQNQLIAHMFGSGNGKHVSLLFFLRLNTGNGVETLCLIQLDNRTIPPVVFKPDSPPQLPRSTWNHVGFIYNENQGFVRFYLNGLQVGSDVPLSTYLRSKKLTRIMIGHSNADNTYGPGFFCRRCDVAQIEIYQRTLTQKEISDSFMRPFRYWQ